MRGNAESKLSISGGKNIKMTTMTLRWKLTLPANICMRNVFLPFPFVPFGFWDLENFSPQRLSVLLSVLTVYSVCRFVSPGVHTSHFLLVFWFWGSKFWCCSFIHFWGFFPLHATFRATTFLPALSSPCSQTLNCSKSVCRSFPGVSLPLHMWTALVLLPLLNAALHSSPFFSLQLTACLGEATCR